MSTARWGSALTARSNNCASCHGGDASNPRFSNMSGGKHWKHIIGYSYRYTCSDCHGTTATGNTTINTPSNHINSKIDVDFNNGIWGGSYPTTGHAPGVDATRTCSSTYCHSNGHMGAGQVQVFVNMTGTRTWYGSERTSLGCSICHGNAAGSTRPLWKTHRHVNTTINPQIGKGYVCTDCHANGGTALNRANYINKLVNYSGAMSGKFTGASPVNCANFYCHSNGKGVYKSMVAAGWSLPTTLNCDGCHGSEAGQPALAAGAPNYLANNSHEKHVAVATTVSNATEQQPLTASNFSRDYNHVTKRSMYGFQPLLLLLTLVFTMLIKPAPPLTATVAPRQLLLPGVPPVPTFCNDCHAAKANDADWATSVNAHRLHYEANVLPSKFANMSGNVSTATVYRFTCSSCHDPRAGKATHANGSREANRPLRCSTAIQLPVISPTYVPGLGLGGSDRGFNFTNGSTSCNATYCHSNGQSGAGFASGAAVTWDNVTKTVNCDKCHGTLLPT